MQQNEYDVTVIKVVDGDTVDVDIDLGFGVCLKDERVRIMGIDTPESRTSDRVEDLFGEAAKARLKELMKHGGKLITTEDKSGEDMKGKFGRILGDFKVPSEMLDSLSVKDASLWSKLRQRYSLTVQLRVNRRAMFTINFS